MLYEHTWIGRQAEVISASEDRYGVTMKYRERVRVAALFYQSQEGLLTPRRYSYIVR